MHHGQNRMDPPHSRPSQHGVHSYAGSIVAIWLNFTATRPRSIAHHLPTSTPRMKTQGQLPRGAEPTSRARTSKAARRAQRRARRRDETRAAASTETLSPAVGGAAAPVWHPVSAPLQPGRLQPLAENRRPGQEKRKKKEEASEGPRARAPYRWTTCAVPSHWEPVKAAKEEAKRHGGIPRGVHVFRAFLATVIKEAADGMQDRKEKEWQAGLKAFKAEVLDKAARPEDLEIICPYFRCAQAGEEPWFLSPKTAIVTWCFGPEGNEATKNMQAACAAAGGEVKVGPILLPVKLFNRIQQPLAQEQEMCHPDKKKKGKDHGPTKTLIMAVLLTCESPSVRAVLTTYVDPHVWKPAKEEAKRAFMAIVEEAEEGMQEGKREWQAARLTSVVFEQHDKGGILLEIFSQISGEVIRDPMLW